MTITRNSKIWNLKHTFLNIIGRSGYRFIWNYDDLKVSFADNNDVIISQNGIQVRMDDYEINRMSIILSLTTSRFHKYGSNQVALHFNRCVDNWSNELLIDPLSTIDRRQKEDFMYEMMVEIVLNFHDFFRFIVNITENKNNALAVE